MNLGGLRRIDSLGRIVMPKSIRKKLRIKSGDNLEIYTQGKEIIIKRHSELKNIEDIIKIIMKLLKEMVKSNIYITDKDKLICTKEIEINLDKEIIKYQKKREITIIERPINLTKKLLLNDIITIYPLISNGDIYGSIIINSKKKLTEEELSTVKLLNSILQKILED